MHILPKSAFSSKIPKMPKYCLKYPKYFPKAGLKMFKFALDAYFFMPELPGSTDYVLNFSSNRGGMTSFVQIYELQVYIHLEIWC